MAALQETRWFGNGVYKVAGSIVLSSGRPVPAQDESRQRGEGVAFLYCLDQQLQLGRWWQFMESIEFYTGDGVYKSITQAICLMLHVFSCYAPTYIVSKEEKDGFFAF